MSRIPPPHVLYLLIRNRRREGWTDRQLADAVRKRLHWHLLDPMQLDEQDKRRYEIVRALLKELERAEP